MSRVMIFVCTFPFLIGGFLTLCMPSPAHAQDAVFFPIVVKQSTPSVESKLPDTGIYFCTDGTDKIDCPGFGEAFYGQDAHSNPWPQQHRYTDNEDNTVTDEVTGLMWMKADDIVQRTWYQAELYCEGNSFYGYNDWRLPEIKEIQYLVDYGRNDSSINPVFTCEAERYWSNTLYADRSDYAWYVNFSHGYTGNLSKDNTYYVRCVRSGPSASAEYQVDDDMVTDTETGLMWMQSDDGTDRDWQTALAYCQNLEHHGYTDWRLPNVNELISLLDYGRTNPAIDSVFACQEDEYSEYWSSSPDAGNPDCALFVYFSSGHMYYAGAEATYGVRCVRGGP